MSQRAAPQSVTATPAPTRAPRRDIAAAASPAPARSATPASAPAPSTAPFAANGDFARLAVSGPPSVLARQAADEQGADRVAEQFSGHTRLPRRTQVAGDGLAEAAAPGIAARVDHWPGRPLESGLRRQMEQHLGGDFGAVRLHTDARAAHAAGALSARAFAVGPHVVFGAGHYEPGSAAGRHLLVHELAHTAQQRGSGRTVLQRDVVDDVREKLSYHLLDWAITDAEALESLALLGNIPVAALPAALTRLGNDYVERLLDNLPDAAKTGAAYQRVITAAGAAGALSYAKEQLDYGVLDWAVTDAEVSRVFNIFETLPATEKQSFLLGLEKANRLSRLMRNANDGHYALYVQPWLKTLTPGRLDSDQRSILRSIVEGAPADPITTLELCTHARYDVAIGPSTIAGYAPTPWNGDKLRQTYLALDNLPEAHVARNMNLLRFGQFTQAPQQLSDGRTSTVGGVYNSGQKELIGNVQSKGDISDDLIHETGHSVDATLGWSAGPEPAKPQRGGWKGYGNSFNGVAVDMVADSAGGITTALTAPQRTDVVTDMVHAMVTRSAGNLNAAVRAHPWFAGLSGANKGAVLDDPALEAIGIGLNSPWFLATDGGKHLGAHVYEESYAQDWSRYEHQARSRMVLPYQFRKAGEWFAVCYAAYYATDNKTKGDKLNSKDPDTKAYFDAVVDVAVGTR